VDNLPVALIPRFADLVFGPSSEINRAAVVVDIRERTGLSRFPAAYRQLIADYGDGVRLVFLQANDATILRRFSETRRPHPLGPDEPLAAGLRRERRALQSLRPLADHAIDTSKLTVHDLRRVVAGLVAGTTKTAPLLVELTSFGFRRGTPPEADLVFDVRFLPNPHFVPSLRAGTGQQAAVSRYVLKWPAAREFLRLTSRLLRFLIPQYISEGKAYLTIAVGCTGGQHRSVAIVHALGRRLRGVKGIEIRHRHRDIEEGR
jgi:UPF0042 nucleotide-binding protein